MPTIKQIAALYHEDLEHFKPYIAQIPVHREYFRKKIQEIKKRGLLLDVGCAMGVLLEEAQRAGFTARGIDISADAVMYCRKKKLDVLEGTLSSVGKKLRENSFDIVTAFEIIEHERDPLGMMSRVLSLLKIGGIAVLTTPNHSSFWRKIMGKWWVGYHHPEHVTFWDPRSLRELFERAGYRDIVIRRDSPRPFPLSFVFTRSADYFPCLAGRRAWAAWILKPIGKFLDHFKIINPINPWDDLIVYATK
jgi:SAM-dependent methyltransferase